MLVGPCRGPECSTTAMAHLMKGPRRSQCNWCILRTKVSLWKRNPIGGNVLISLHIRSMWETICDAWACWSGWNFGPNSTEYPYSEIQFQNPIGGNVLIGSFFPLLLHSIYVGLCAVILHAVSNKWNFCSNVREAMKWKAILLTFWQLTITSLSVYSRLEIKSERKLIGLHTETIWLSVMQSSELAGEISC